MKFRQASFSPIPVFGILLLSISGNLYLGFQNSALKEEVQKRITFRDASSPQVRRDAVPLQVSSTQPVPVRNRGSLILNADPNADPSGGSVDAVSGIPEDQLSADLLAISGRDSEAMVKKMEAVIVLSPELRERVKAYFFETQAGTRPVFSPPPTEDGEIMDELAFILGKELFTTWENWLKGESERASNVEIEKQVSYLGQSLGLDTEGEAKLRRALQNPEEDSAKETSLIRRTLDLTTEQYEAVTSFWSSIDSEVAERSDALLKERVSESDDPIQTANLGLSSDDYSSLRQRVIHEHLEAILSPEQLKKLPGYEALVAPPVY